MSTEEAFAVRFEGRRAVLAGLAARTGLLTLLTLGFYRFWAKTRLRRWYWSAIRPGGHPLEYTGDGVEKITGFLIAVVILAFWPAIVNLLVMFASLTFFSTPELAYALSLLLLVPLWFWARYRARTYVLARTRWRGIRFAMAPGAWGYAWRAILLWSLTILSLGFLWPVMTFRLEKYITDRTFFGTGRFEQGGRSRMLYRSFAPAYVAALLCAGVCALGAGFDPRAFWLLGPFGFFFAAMAIRYRVRSIGIMASEKRLGRLRLYSRPNPARVARIMGYGGLAITILLLLPVLMLSLLELLLLPEDIFAGPVDLLAMGPVKWFAVGLFVIIYFGVFLMWGVLRHVLITAPVWRHYAESLEVLNVSELHNVVQRPRDAAKGAEGFAEALDLGAAI